MSKQRKIKFRAWNRKLKKFVDKNELKHYAIALDGEVINFDSSGYDYIDHFEILRCTGLKDRHDVEIYEGDIIKTWDGAVLPITFNRGCFRMGYGSGGLSGSLNVFMGDDECEVIGNIYENPELLED